MKKVPFKTNYVDGRENVMVLDDISPIEIRFNQETREIAILYKHKEPWKNRHLYRTRMQKKVKESAPKITVIKLPKYKKENLVVMGWRSIKKLVLENKGEWKNKKDGVDYLVNM